MIDKIKKYLQEGRMRAQKLAEGRKLLAALQWPEAELTRGGLTISWPTSVWPTCGR